MSDGVVMDRLGAASARLRFQLVHHKACSASGAHCVPQGGVAGASCQQLVSIYSLSVVFGASLARCLMTSASAWIFPDTDIEFEAALDSAMVWRPR